MLGRLNWLIMDMKGDCWHTLSHTPRLQAGTSLGCRRYCRDVRYIHSSSRSCERGKQTKGQAYLWDLLVKLLQNAQILPTQPFHCSSSHNSSQSLMLLGVGWEAVVLWSLMEGWKSCIWRGTVAPSRCRGRTKGSSNIHKIAARSLKIPTLSRK